MVVGDIEQHHHRVYGQERSYSESEEGGNEMSEDQEKQERIFILEEADELGSPIQREGRTAPRPSPTPVLDLPQEDVVVWDHQSDIYYHPVTESIETGGAYMVGVITNEDRGVSSRTRMILDQGYQVNPGVIISE